MSSNGLLCFLCKGCLWLVIYLIEFLILLLCYTLCRLPPTYNASFHDAERVQKMLYRPLGSTGLDVSILSFGRYFVSSSSFSGVEYKCA